MYISDPDEAWTLHSLKEIPALVTTLTMQHWSPETQHLQPPTTSRLHLSLSPHGCARRLMVRDNIYLEGMRRSLPS